MSLPQVEFSVTLFISEGEDKNAVEASIEDLPRNGWQTTEDGLDIRKTYNFKTFTKAVVGVLSLFLVYKKTWLRKDFFNLVAIRSKSEDHHSTVVIVSATLFNV